MIRKERLWLLILFIAYFTIVYIIMWKTGITCVYLHFFGIPCPGCGMTRALLSVLQFDFVSALKYNPIIFFMPYIFAYIFLEFKNKKVHNNIITVIGVLALVNWIVRIVQTLS